MVAVVNGDRIDIHNYQQRLERAVRFLEKHEQITEENKAEIVRFLEHIKAENLSLARQVSYVQWMTTIAANLGRKSFNQTKKQDVETLLAKFKGKRWSEATKENYHEAVKKFWRWLRGLPLGEDPEETEWVKVGGAKGRKIIPEELLTTEEANHIIAAAEHPVIKPTPQSQTSQGRDLKKS
jgi:site-specific recombinase XerD